MAKLTFLLPLKDRPNYTRIWLMHNLRPEYDYYIADGSIGDENETLLSVIHLPNLTYVRYPKDLTIECFVEKMFQAVSQIKTQYVMTCDNDDFINYQGITQCVDALDCDPEPACAGGPIYGVMQCAGDSVMHRYSLPVKILDAKELHNRAGFDALVLLFKNYKYAWYSIFRTEDYQSIWQNMKQLQISNVFLMELLQTQLTFCHGKYIQVKANHYIRLSNPTTSHAREESQKAPSHVFNIFFDDEYRCQALRMSEHIAKLVGVEPSHLLSEFKNYYTSAMAPQCSTFYSKTWSRLIQIHVIIPRKLHIFFPIEFGIRWINLFRKNA